MLFSLVNMILSLFIVCTLSIVIFKGKFTVDKLIPMNKEYEICVNKPIILNNRYSKYL